jgi:hypothetical protein
LFFSPAKVVRIGQLNAQLRIGSTPTRMLATGRFRRLLRELDRADKIR